MRLFVLALVLAASAAAQTSLADGSGLYLALGDFDVLDSRGDRGVDVVLGWRFDQASDVGVSLDAQQYPEVASYLDLRVRAGHTWTPAARVGLRLAGSAGYGWRSDQVRGQEERADGVVADLETTAYYHLPLVGSVDVRPTLGAFVQIHSADERTVGSLSPVGDLRDSVGGIVGLPIAFRLLGADLAVAPTVRLGVGLEDHAFWGDGAMRLHLNL